MLNHATYLIEDHWRSFKQIQMKKISILLILFSGLISCDQNIKTDNRINSEAYSTLEKNDIEAVKNLVTNSFEDIWSNLDSTKIERYYTDDFMLLENGIVWNNDSVRSYLNRERIEMEIQNYNRLNQFEFLKSVNNKNTIWIAYDNYGTWVKGTDTLGTVHWLESVIAIKNQDSWKLQQLHSTTVRK